MDIKDALKDIIKHTHGLGFLDMVKLIGSSEETKIESMDNDKSVIMYGTMYQPIEELNSTIGLSRLNVLRGYLDYAKFADDTSTITVVKQEKDGNNVPVEIKFEGAGNKANYRFMSEAMVNEQIKVPPFKGAVWHAVVNPTKAALSDLS